jgi:hypothetical protein
MEDKRYLFILQNEKTDIVIETYTTDENGNYLTEKATIVSMPNLVVDARLALVEKAISDKIKFHHKLEFNDFTLSESIEKTYQKLLNKTDNSNITIRFEAKGRPPADNYVLFIKEDKEIKFSFKQITSDAYQTLKNRIGIAEKGPLSIFEKIYVFEGLLGQNRLYKSLIEEFGDNKITTDSGNLVQRSNELKGLKVLTLEQRAEIEHKVKAKREAETETENYENLAKNWDSNDASLRDKINHCKTFLTNFPDSKRKSEIEGKILGFQDNEAWQKADNEKSVEDYTNYLSQYPEGAFKEEAQRVIFEIKKTQKKIEEQKKEADALAIKELKEFKEASQEKNRKTKQRLLVAASVVAVIISGFSIKHLFLNSSKYEFSNAVPTPPVFVANSNLKDQINCTLKSISDSLKLNNLEGKVRTKLYSDEIKLKDILDIPVQDYQKTLTSMEVSIHSKCK